jgi:hypothetical protein
MKISLRPAQPDDLIFARQLYYETMRWTIERQWCQHSPTA